MRSIIEYYVPYYIYSLNKDRRAAGALEYALLVSFIAIAVIAGVTTFGTNLSAFFAALATKVSTMTGNVK
jgi:Flp pilus assembly pilin Flp